MVDVTGLPDYPLPEGLRAAKAAQVAKRDWLPPSRILVTGGTRGIGRAVVEALARREGVVVYLGCRDLAAGQAVAPHDGVVPVLLDVTDPASIKTAVETVRAAGGLDALVNNAGVSIPGSIHKGIKERIPPMDSSWDRTLATNLTAGVLILNSLAPSMVARGFGRVVHISSIGGLGSSEGRSAYTASKAALIGLGHTGALELGPHGVTVNVVCP